MVYGRASLGRSVSQGGPVSRWAGEQVSGRAGERAALWKSRLELLDGDLTWALDTCSPVTGESGTVLPLLLCHAVSLVNCSHIIIADILTAALLGLFCSANSTYVFFIYALPLKLPFTTQNYILLYLVLGPYRGLWETTHYDFIPFFLI